MSGARISIAVATEEAEDTSLRDDVLAGLFGDPKVLPPRHFYDTRGSELFDAICDTPEYYPTRAEDALLKAHARTILETNRPQSLIELGSGTARKTRRLFDAAQALELELTYVPVDVSEATLRESATALLQEYPWLRVQGVVGAFQDGLERLPTDPPRLFAFLGGTIGNFDSAEATDFLRSLHARMGSEDLFLLGCDLVKDEKRLNAAYNDAQGITAKFNKNVLAVMNRDLGANFDLEAFEHQAYFDPETARIEIYLRSRRLQKVHFTALDRTAHFEAGETLRTEVSQKFTEESLRGLLASADLEPMRVFVPDDRAFVLTLARPA